MNKSSDDTYEIVSEVSDLEHVPLAEMTDHDGALSGALHRVLPAQDAAHVPVAAFNSSI